MKRYLRLLLALLKARDGVDVALKLLPLLSRRGATRLAAFLLARAIRPLNSRPSASYRVLVIEKAVFNDDIRAALGGAEDIALFGIGRAVVKAMALGILPRHICADDTYISDESGAGAAKLRYRRFLDAVWPRLERHMKFDAVLTGNWAYWAERELGAVLEARGVPFIVMHKEGIKPPARSEMLRHLFRVTRGQFMGRRMLVYQEAERQHQVDGDISRPEQIVVVGMPRMDRLHAWRRRAADGDVPACRSRPLVLFLAFLPNNFLPSYSGLESDLAWDGLCAGSLRAMIRVALENPACEVLIRPRGQEIDETVTLLGQTCGALGIPANLKVSTNGDVFDLLTAAWVVVGHNTTVLLEGLAAGKPVIVPEFAEARDERYRGYIVDVGASAENADCEDALVEMVSDRCRAAPVIEAQLPPASIEALNRWTGNTDGRASERVRAAIRAEIQTPGQN